MTQSSPSNQPSNMPGQAGQGQARPKDLTPQELAAIKAGAAAPHAATATPSNLSRVIPPGAGMAAPSATPAHAASGGAGSTWGTDTRVGALWSINQDRNSWVYITNVGWIRLSTASESGTIALTVLSAHAKELQKRYDYREESDGMIHEVYVW